jgi:glucosylceramidase
LVNITLNRLSTIEIILILVTSLPCAIKSVSTGIVCVCNSTYCDTLDVKLPVKAGEVLIVSTSKSGLRFRTGHGKFNEKKISIPHGDFFYGSSAENHSPYMKKFMKIVKQIDGINDPIDNVVNVALDRNEKFQKIIGFGGAFTGAVSYNLKQLSKEVQDHIYHSYYSKDTGIGYNLMRIPIGGCDFDLAPWAYNEHPEHDPYLTNFTHLDERDLDKIQQIHELMKVTKNRDIKVFGAAWSPPKWMKSNGEYTGMSCLRDEYYQTWADYHVKYLELMAKSSLPFWAISTGNEPMNWMFAPFMR